MQLLIILICALVYLFIGGFLCGILLNSIDDNWWDYGMVALFWPIIAVAILIVALIAGPVKLGQLLKERINRK